MVRNYKRKTEDRWSKEDLLEALTSIKESKLKINDAARQYRISRATLYRQFKKFLQAGGKCDVNQFRTCGGNPILTKVEEDVLEKTIRDLREQGFTVTSSDIKRICFEYCDSNGIPNQFNQEKRMASDDWYYGFLKRHPDVRIDPGTGDGSVTSAETSPSKGRKKKKKLKVDDALMMKGERAPTLVLETASVSASGKKEAAGAKRKNTASPKRSNKKTRTETVVVKQEEDIADQLLDEGDDMEGDDESETPEGNPENPETDGSSKADEEEDEEEADEEDDEEEQEADDDEDDRDEAEADPDDEEDEEEEDDD